MYEIYKNNYLIFLVDKLIYIKMQDNGCYGEATEADATGIAVNGTPYHLLGRPELEGVTEEVSVHHVDSGVYMMKTTQNSADIAYLSMMTGVDIPTTTKEA